MYNLDGIPQGWEVFRREVGFIKDENLKEFVKIVLEKAPTYFWRMSASSSGKYHPADDNLTGGLILHSKKVVNLARELAVAMEQEKYLDELTVAGILHDFVKYGGGQTPNVKEFNEHGAKVETYVRRVSPVPKDLEEKMKVVFDLCRTHYGIWSIQENKPVSRLQWVLFLADYVVSRKNIRVEGVI
jgi:hypothetical protein